MKATRRSFIGATASLLAYVAANPLYAVAETTESARLIYKLTILVSNRQAAARFGQAYLETHPGEAAPGKLAELICSAAPDTLEKIIQSPPGDRRELLNRLIAADFGKGQTVEIHGWVLARTEARLYALVSTLPATP